MDNTQDIDLIQGCIDKNPIAQRLLYDTYVQSMYNTVYRYTCNHEDTKDILQTAFTKVYSSLDRFEPTKGNLHSWMRKIHINSALDFIKKKNVYFKNVKDFHQSRDWNDKILSELETEYIYNFIAELDLRDRTIFNLYLIEGYSYKEIASILDINPNSCRVYVSRIRNTLQQRINEYYLRLNEA